MILLSFFIFIFGGCSAKTPPEPQMDFTASVHISYGDSLSRRSTYQAQLTSTSQGMIVLRLLSDDVLNNLQYKWEDKLTLSYGDMHLKTETNYLPQFSFPQGIYNVLFALPRTGEFEGFDEDSAIFSGVTPSGGYKVKTDRNGAIEEISIEELSLVVDFSYDL